MKRKVTVKKLSLPMSALIATATMIIMVLAFCGISAWLILNGSIQESNIKITSRIMVALAAFAGTRIALKNDMKYPATGAYAVCTLLVMLGCAIALKISIANFVSFLLFMALGTAVGMLSNNIKPKKSHFQKRRYR